jgi:Kef-type K+ transport system membrane component KefB/voltage-gated potassium channel Kch
MTATFVHDFGILFLVILALSFIVKFLKQPIIVGYVLAGLVFSLASSTSGEQVIILSSLGITFLLFLMGMEFDLKSLKSLGKDIILITLQKSLVFFAVAFGLAKLFGFSNIYSVYIGILFMFSSTLLVAKWIDDKKETNTLYGRMALGILVTEDILAIIALTFLGVVQEKSLTNLIIIPISGMLILLAATFFARYVLNLLLKFAVKHSELLFISSLGLCFAFVELAPLLGYSETIGAFLAGIVIANTAYKNDIYSRMKPLIIFFNMLFFVGLGFQLNTPLTKNAILLIGILCLLALMLKPAVTYFLLRKRGYDSKTSFLVGADLSQLSEFGIIVVAGGAASGAIGYDLGAISVIAVISTMVLSSYLIKYDRKLFKSSETFISKFDKMFKHKDMNEQSIESTGDFSVILFGYHDVGKELYSKIMNMGKKIMVVENDPTNIDLLKKENIPCIYSSVSNSDFFERLSLAKTELVISSLMDIDENKIILKNAKESNPSSTVILTAKNLKDSLELYAENADYVICPTYLNREEVIVVLEDYATDINKIIDKRLKEYAVLKEMEKKREALERENSFLSIDEFLKRVTAKPQEPTFKEAVDAHQKPAQEA